MVKVLHLYAGNLYGGIETLLTTMARLRHLAPGMDPEFGLCFRGRLWDELVATGVDGSRPWARPAQPAVDGLAGPTAAAAGFGGPPARGGGHPRLLAAYGVRPRGAAGRHPAGPFRSWSGEWPTLAGAVGESHSAGPGRRQQPVHRRVGREMSSPRSGSSRGIYPSPGVLSTNPYAHRCGSELGTSDGTVVILQASRLERWKGQAVHLEALGLLRDVPGWECWLAGGVAESGRGDSSWPSCGRPRSEPESRTGCGSWASGRTCPG